MLFFGPDLCRVERMPHFPRGLVDARDDPYFEEKMQTIWRPEYYVQEPFYLAYGNAELLTGNRVLRFPYSIIHPDLVAEGKAGVRQDAKIEMVAIAQHIWNQDAGISNARVICDDEHHMLILKIRSKDLMRLADEIHTGKRPKPGKAENIIWLERVKRAREVRCKDATYWR